MCVVVTRNSLSHKIVPCQRCREPLSPCLERKQSRKCCIYLVWKHDFQDLVIFVNLHRGHRRSAPHTRCRCAVLVLPWAVRGDGVLRLCNECLQYFNLDDISNTYIHTHSLPNVPRQCSMVHVRHTLAAQKCWQKQQSNPEFPAHMFLAY